MKLCAPLQINQDDEDIVEQEKKICTTGTAAQN